MNNNLLKGGIVTLLLLALATIGLTFAQQRPTLTPEQLERLTIRPVPGKAGLYLMPGCDGNMSGGNIAIRVTEEGVIIVDNKYSYSYENITRQVASVTDQPIRYVLNTHHHFDHAGSNASFMPSAQVIGHENVRINMLRNSGPSASPDGAPRITFNDKTSVHLGDAEVQAFHLGCGHTNGDSVILFPDLRTIHTGDLFIWGDRLDGTTMAPFIDYANGGCAGDWVATLDQILALDFDTVIPGHGPLLRKAEIRIFRDKFEQMVTRIRTLMNNGTSRNDIAAALDISDLNWPLAPDRVQAIYDELSQ
ncbi:MAG: MBL fold metallo-hydrolase [Pseudomonadales bacterium]|nr:MBL fold metallo-hydrolase [Pseudomonadales bacterium]